MKTIFVGVVLFLIWGGFYAMLQKDCGGFSVIPFIFAFSIASGVSAIVVENAFSTKR